MKNLLIGIVALSLISFHSKAQERENYPDTIIKEKHINSLWVIRLSNGKKLYTKHFISGFEQIKDGQFVSRNKVKQDYGSYDVDVVMEVSIKAGVPIITLSKLLDKYHINSKYRTYAILCENAEIKDPSDIVINEDDIKTVVVNHEKRFINIITRLYQGTLKYRKSMELDSQKNPQIYKSGN